MNCNVSILYILFSGLLVAFVHGQICQVSGSDSITAIDCNTVRLVGRDLHLDSNIPSTSKLVVLNLNNCSGRIDDHSFSNIKHLRSLNIDNCVLEKFKVPNIPDLKDLDIRNSFLPRITRASLKNGKNLKRIALSENRVDITSGSFQDLTALTALDIEHQNITLDKHFLRGLRNLILLSITDSTVTQLSSDSFTEVPELLDLNLERNPIQHIENGALDPLKKLKNLNLLDNQLDKLEVSLFKETRNLESIRVPARVVKNFDLKKFLEYCPRFSNFDFSLSDCGEPEAKSLGRQADKLNAYIYIYYDGIDRPDRC
ncbi:tsukushi-like [Diabrotica undecimpunctata]|uniref:tsukushi-like n=1 Tax=Diabrotica undecimpunctata TaxID=50387 RepID=UPI003B63EDF8